jgi:hypothetical protein
MSSTGEALDITAARKENTAVVVPIPTARVAMAAALVPGASRNCRSALLTSSHSPCILLALPIR